MGRNYSLPLVEGNLCSVSIKRISTPLELVPKDELSYVVKLRIDFNHRKRLDCMLSDAKKAHDDAAAQGHGTFSQSSMENSSVLGRNMTTV
jgi:hypothetical protein